MINSIFIFNAESMYFYIFDKEFRGLVDQADQLCCDSASLSGSLFIRGVKHARIHGPDFMHDYLLGNKNKRLALIGGKEIAHQKIINDYQLSKTFLYSGEVSEKTEPALIDSIIAFKPDMVFICLGLRKQEKFMIGLKARAESCSSGAHFSQVGVGAAVDFLGGTKKRAGHAWRRIGLEWLPRLMREPRMLPRLGRSLIGAGLVFVLKACFLREIEKFKS